MDRKSQVVRTTVSMKETAAPKARPQGSSDEGGFLFGWEGTTLDPLMYVAREIVDQVWPNTDTPDVVNGVWDDTPIMRAVLVALKRGMELRNDAADA